MVLSRVVSDSYLDNKESKKSRYRKTNMTLDEKVQVGTLRFQIWTKPNIDTSDIINWTRHTVVESQEMRVDGISYIYYGTVDYWWAIAQVNNIKNPLNDIPIQTVLYIPPVEEIENALGA